VITGTNLQGATLVTINRTTADVENPPVVNEAGTEVRVFITVPAGEVTGSATVTVSTPQGNPTVGVTIVGTATITSISPSTLVLGQRTEVVITGTNLQGATLVTINRATADVENPPVLNEAGTELRVFITVPTGEEAGTAIITVSTPQGNPTVNIDLVRVGTGDLQATLTWDTDGTDLDIHVIEPDSSHVFWNNQNGTTAELDIDDVDGFGPENIFVQPGKASSGTYEIFIVYYDGSVSTTATITIKLFADTPQEVTATFTRVLTDPDVNVGINVANVSFPDGTIEETIGTRDISGLGRVESGPLNRGKK
jgi:hypothetical protein